MLNANDPLAVVPIDDMDEDRRILMELLDSEETWMQSHAINIREALAIATRNQLLAGRWLMDVKNKLNHGDWMPWIDREFGFGIRTADRYIVAYAYADVYAPDLLESLDVPLTVLYLLAGDGIPESIKRDVGDGLSSGQRFTVAAIQGMAQNLIESRSRSVALDNASETVHDLALQYELDSAVMEVLGMVEERMPELFAEIVASGVVHDYNGNPISLESANGREIRSYVNQVSMEAAISEKPGTAQDVPMGDPTNSLHVLLVLEDERPKSLNTFYKGAHFSVRNEERDRVKPRVIAALRDSRAIQDIVGFRVHIDIRAYFKGPDIDPDNIATKPYIDGLIGELIQDDSREFVGRVSRESHHDKENPRVEIRITQYRPDSPLIGDIVVESSEALDARYTAHYENNLDSDGN